MSSQPGVDYAFWLGYLLVVLPAILAGWWLRGVVERERDNMEIERARQMHPSSSQSKIELFTTDLLPRDLHPPLSREEIQRRYPSAAWQASGTGDEWDARGDEEMGP